MRLTARIRVILLLTLAAEKCAEAWTSSASTRVLLHHQRTIRRVVGVSHSRPARHLSLYSTAIDDGDCLEAATSKENNGSGLLNRKPVKGDVVTVSCRLKPEHGFVPDALIDGVVLHEEDAPAILTFVLYGGNYLPGLHDLVATMLPLQKVVKVSLDAGWGARNPDLMATLTYADAGVDASQIKQGVELFLENGLKCVVTGVTAHNFTIDANPPLAGASYLADVELRCVEMGPTPVPYDASKAVAAGSESRYELATFALGCFWGTELAFMREPGVVGTAVGYTQGQTTDPSYDQVCSGTTGHTEAALVTYDPAVTSYETLVRVAMDRLGENKYLLNQVGSDKGTQYRHGIYYHTPAQKHIAECILVQYGDDCVTECKPAAKWYPAEDYHQQYLLKGGQSARKGDATAIRCYG
jgi:peptide-methionine (S)-S-oxide reductase